MGNGWRPVLKAVIVLAFASMIGAGVAWFLSRQISPLPASRSTIAETSKEISGSVLRLLTIPKSDGVLSLTPEERDLRRRIDSLGVVLIGQSTGRAVW